MLYVTDKSRTAFISSSAHSYDIIPGFVEIFTDIVRCMSAYVDAYFLHNLHGARIDLFRRLSSGGKHFNLRIKRLENAMRHLTAATIAGA